MIYKVYGKDNCVFCDRAVALLKSKNLEHFVYKLGQDFDRDQLLVMFPNAKTFPQINVVSHDETSYVGGYNELVEYLKETD